MGAKLAAGSLKLCSWACLGFGDCVTVCKFNALTMDMEKGLPVADYSKCTGCRMCINGCPQNLYTGVTRGQKGAITLCANLSPNRQEVSKTCKTACIKCGLCVKNCPQRCINMDSHIPVIDWAKCNSCGICVEKCPAKVLKLIEKDIITA